LRTILPRHEQGGGFAAQGYARSTGKPGVCMATSGPGATNLVTAIADAKLDSVPLIAITGQVPRGHRHRRLSGNADRRSLPRHHQASLPGDRRERPRIMREAFHVATTGRPGPVLIDMPKNVQLGAIVPDWDAPMNLPGYHGRTGGASPSRSSRSPRRSSWPSGRSSTPAAASSAAEASDELREFVRKTGIPVTMTVMGLGAFPGRGSAVARHAGHARQRVRQLRGRRDCDLLIALGVRFDDRVTGKLEEFAKHAKIVHVDVDPRSSTRTSRPTSRSCSDVKYALAELNKIVEPPEDIWKSGSTQCQQWKRRPVQVQRGVRRHPAAARDRELWRLTGDRDTYITSAWASTRCGRPSSTSSATRGRGSPERAWARWASACPRRWARRPRIPTAGGRHRRRRQLS
jgi:acetolactate synthase I/II/III large subunit